MQNIEETIRSIVTVPALQHACSDVLMAFAKRPVNIFLAFIGTRVLEISLRLGSGDEGVMRSNKVANLIRQWRSKQEVWRERLVRYVMFLIIFLYPYQSYFRQRCGETAEHLVFTGPV